LLSPPFLDDLSGALGSLPCSGHGAILNVRGSWVCWLVTGKIHSFTHACSYYANFMTYTKYSYYTCNNYTYKHCGVLEMNHPTPHKKIYTVQST
jgi:hypothetical protein